MAEHGIIGDQYGTELPETIIPEEELVAEKKAARFSKTAEFKQLKEYLEDRIAFYQTHLPDGRVINESQNLAQDWLVATAIIAEFRAVIAAYETAQEAVKNAQRQ